MTGKKGLTEKQRLFAKNLIRSKGDQKAAYLETYPSISRSSAAAAASRLLTQKPEILSLAREALEKQGVTLEQLSKKLKEKLDCEKALTVGNDVHYVNDNSAQLKAVELSYKIHGALKDVDNSVNINVQHNQAVILDRLGSRLDAVLRMFEPLEVEALGDGAIYRNIGDNVKNNPQLMDNLSTGSDEVSTWKPEATGYNPDGTRLCDDVKDTRKSDVG